MAGRLIVSALVFIMEIDFGPERRAQMWQNKVARTFKGINWLTVCTPKRPALSNEEELVGYQAILPAGVIDAYNFQLFI